MKKILIVDDEEEIRDFLRDYFESKGYNVITAATKEEALKALVEEKPPVALLDIRMYGSNDGIEILRWIKEQKLPVKTIMVTALETLEAVRETANLGADDYVTKPLSLDYLETRISRKIASLIKATDKNA